MREMTVLVAVLAIVAPTRATPAVLSASRSSQRADASRAVPSESARRKRAPVERPISGHASPGDELFRRPGQLLLQAQQQAIQWIGQQVQAQASFLAYMDAFWVLMLISLAAVPLALSLRKVKLGGAVHVGH